MEADPAEAPTISHLEAGSRLFISQVCTTLLAATIEQ